MGLESAESRLLEALRAKPDGVALELRVAGRAPQRSAWPFPHPARLWLGALLLHRPLRRLGLLEDVGTWQPDEERCVGFLGRHGGPLAWPLARLALLTGSLLRGRWSPARVAVERGS